MLTSVVMGLHPGYNGKRGHSVMAINQGVSEDHREGLFTAPSVDALLERAAESLHAFCRKFARDRWWWLREEDFQEPTRRWTRQEIKSQRSAIVFLASEQAPALRCFMRVTWNFHPQRRFHPPVYLLVEFRQTPGMTEEAWTHFQEEPTLDRHRALWRVSKQVVVQVCLGKLASRKRNKWQQALRRSDAWRFDPKRRPPLEEQIQRLRQKGDKDGANDLQVFIDTLHPEVKAKWENRETPWWRTVWIHPHKQTADDVHFLLLLILLQEDMISLTEALQAQTMGYLRRFKGVSDDGTAYLVLEALRRHFTEPEDWRALRKYVGRAVRTLERGREWWAVPGDPEETHQRAVRHELRGTSPLRAPQLIDPDKEPPRWSIRAAAAQLKAEDLAVTPDAIYDLINTGKIPCQQEGGRRWLDAEGLEHVRDHLKEGVKRRALRLLLIEKGRTPEATKKFIRRRLKANMTLDMILQELGATGRQ